MDAECVFYPNKEAVLAARVAALEEWQKAADFKELRDMVGVRLEAIERLLHNVDVRLAKEEDRLAHMRGAKLQNRVPERLEAIERRSRDVDIRLSSVEKRLRPKTYSVNPPICVASEKPQPRRKARAGDVVRVSGDGGVRLLIVGPEGLDAKDANDVQCRGTECIQSNYNRGVYIPLFNVFDLMMSNPK